MRITGLSFGLLLCFTSCLEVMAAEPTPLAAIAESGYSIK